MTIASDFFFDLTPKSSTPAYSYDIVESELLPTPKGGFNNRIESSIKQNRSAPIILEGTPNRNFSNRENSDFDNIYLKTKISKSSDRFKFTVVKRSNPMLSPLSSHSTRKFNIVRVPKNSNCSFSSEENEAQENDGTHIYTDHNKIQDDEGIINLF